MWCVYYGREIRQNIKRMVTLHHYAYYRCTKRIKPDCSQKDDKRYSSLEKQIIEILEKIEIPSEFHKWAIKCLKEEQGKESDDRNEILKSQQRRLDNCTRRLESLFQMRIDGEIDANEYLQRRTNLLQKNRNMNSLLLMQIIELKRGWTMQRNSFPLQRRQKKDLRMEV